MPFTDYRPPVARLLELGDPFDDQDEISYRELGLSETDVPELCRLVRAGTLHHEEADDLEAYGSVHAWRALGELRAEGAIDTLIGEFRHAEMDDWVMEELPAILTQIGPVAIPSLIAYLEDDSNEIWARATAAASLTAIALAAPETRERCVAILSGELARFAEQDVSFNALLIGELLSLKAVEAAPLMEQAFAAGAVELIHTGDWEDVQIELGLLEQRLTPKPDYFLETYGYSLPKFRESEPKPHKTAANKTKKAKRKQQTKSRQRNRKKK